MRRPPTKAQKAEVLARQSDGLCGCGCRKPLQGPLRWEHVVPLWAKGTNATGNFERWRLECSKAKDAREAGDRARMDAARKRHEGTRRPRKPIPSRGFDKQWRRKFNGQVERRV